MLPTFANEEQIRTNQKIMYYNIPAAFDIETSSFYYREEKTAIMYEWTLGICGYITTGRTWEEFIKLYDSICDVFHTDQTNRLVIYVHNLSYEFQFMRNHFRWEKVFSLEERKPIQAITVDGIEFRCSYKLSGYSLDNLSNQLTVYKCHKTHDLDYNKIRHSKTPLTDLELSYCLTDVLVCLCYIQELIEREGDVTKIPLTKTGFVRRYCRNKCLYEGDDKFNTKFKKYRALMRSLSLTPDIYHSLQRAFAGGFTHANAYYQGDVIEDISSFDFTSSYPYVMVSEKFPMSAGKLIPTPMSKNTFSKLLKTYCCLFDMELTNVRPKVWYENYISKSKCYEIEGAEVNNGRVSSAKRLIITVTEQDYFIIRRMYEWDDMKIGNFYTFVKDYLPTDFVKSILDLYVKKTTLKGVAGKEVEYLISKENVNSCYGMTVTNICRESIKYDGGQWGTEAPDYDEAIEKNNRSVRRFLYYPWGVWVTAYARANLFTGIIEFGDDYVYSDTDSIKVRNLEKHMNYINKYNELVSYKLKMACEHHGFDISITEPLTIEGKKKQLGVWDFEGTYSRFKTLGAKRYLTEKLDKKTNRLVQQLTVAGLSKSIALDYMKEVSPDVFEAFNEDLYIPKGRTGKNVHTYIDEEQHGVIKDYLGIKCEFHELSSVHLEAADYSFSISEDYINYILKIKTEELTGY